MKSVEKLKLCQKIDWDSLNITTIASIALEILILAVFALFHQEGDFIISYSFFSVWIIISAFVNLLLLFLLVTYRPKLWGVQVLLLILLPLIPAWFVMTDFGFVFLAFIEKLSR